MSPGSRVAVGAAAVKVPATSANLGPGYDALALSLGLYDQVSARVTGDGLHITAQGEGADQVARDESHLIVRAMRATFAHLGVIVPGLSLTCMNRIPHGRGLGSSAAAICAGVLLARQLVPDGPGLVDQAGVLDLSARIEGHPDNVAACLLGGLTIAWTDAGAYRAMRLEPHIGLHPVVFVPGFESSTEQARRLLPATVPHADAAFNAARAALLVAGLTEDLSVLLAATQDRLHQPYRAPAMPATAELVASLRTAGVAAVVSGAGPSVLALATSVQEQAQALTMAPPQWTTFAPAVDLGGAMATTVISTE